MGLRIELFNKLSKGSRLLLLVQFDYRQAGIYWTRKFGYYEPIAGWSSTDVGKMNIRIRWRQFWRFQVGSQHVRFREGI